MRKIRKLRQPKVLGEFGEMCFTAKAASLGLVVAQPHIESMPYDMIVDNGTRLFRVQVKTVGRQRRAGIYAAMTARGGIRPYVPSQVDFVVIYVLPEEVWYVIPVRTLGGRTAIYLYPHVRGSRGRFERYREAWHLLAPHTTLLRRIFAQAAVEPAVACDPCRGPSVTHAGCDASPLSAFVTD